MDTNWAQKVADLEGLGWTLVELGREVGLSTGAISDVKRGASKEPRGMAAVRLHHLHSTRALPARLRDPQQAA